MRHTGIILGALLFSSNVLAWQGLNLDTGGAIEIRTEGAESFESGNVEYYDYELDEIKLGYLNMYENNLGLIIDLETGDLLRVHMESVKKTSQ